MSLRRLALGRIALSFVSAAVSVIIVSFAISITARPFALEGFKNNFEGGVIGIGMFASFGWLIALPLVVFFRSIRRKNFVWLVMIGTSVGPAIMLLVDVVGLLLGNSSENRMGLSSNLRIVTLAGAVAFLTTFFYLLVRIQFDGASKSHHDR